jgi:hypothetical protein
MIYYIVRRTDGKWLGTDQEIDHYILCNLKSDGCVSFRSFNDAADAIADLRKSHPENNDRAFDIIISIEQIVQTIYAKDQ